MRVFISFSGVPSVSHSVAKALHDWLPTVLQAVEPWLSDDDIFKGQSWTKELSSALESSTFGIFCLTQDNLHSPWITFEAGALSKTFRVCPLLINVSPGDIKDHPLAQFQHSSLDRENMLSMVLSINDAAEAQSVERSKVIKAFEVCWAALEQQIREIMRELPIPAPFSPLPTTRTFKLLMSQGTLINPSDQSRNVAFKVHTINTILAALGHALEQHCGNEAARNAFWSAGRDAGQDFAQNIKVQWSLQYPSDTVRDQIARWCNFDSDVGWGHISSQLDIDEERGELSGTISLLNNFQIYDRKRGNYPDCSLMFGYIQGVLETLCAGIPITVECRRDDHCPLLNTFKQECIFTISPGGSNG